MTLTTSAASARVRRNDADRAPALKPTRSLATDAPVADTNAGADTPGVALLMSPNVTPTGHVPAGHVDRGAALRVGVRGAARRGADARGRRARAQAPGARRHARCEQSAPV
jgi:hypothetical protein